MIQVSSAVWPDQKQRQPIRWHSTVCSSHQPRQSQGRLELHTHSSQLLTTTNTCINYGRVRLWCTQPLTHLKPPYCCVSWSRALSGCSEVAWCSCFSEGMGNITTHPYLSPRYCVYSSLFVWRKWSFCRDTRLSHFSYALFAACRWHSLNSSSSISKVTYSKAHLTWRNLYIFQCP